ncbi:hypothetical protein D3C77_518400 [compost metagenome]
MLAHFLQIAKRFKKLRRILEWNARRQQKDIPVIIGAHPHRDLPFIIGQSLEIHLDIGIFLVKFCSILLENRIHNICSLRDYGNFAFNSASSICRAAATVRPAAGFPVTAIAAAASQHAKHEH